MRLGAQTVLLGALQSQEMSLCRRRAGHGPSVLSAFGGPCLSELEETPALSRGAGSWGHWHWWQRGEAPVMTFRVRP